MDDIERLPAASRRAPPGVGAPRTSVQIRPEGRRRDFVSARRGPELEIGHFKEIFH